MSSRLNKILYNYDVFDTAESIIALEPYMVGGSGLQKIIIPPTIVIQEEQEDSVPIPTETGIRTDKFFPKQGQDTLFWSIFIAHYGLKEFYNVDRYKNREIDEKVNIMNYIRSLSKTEIKITKTSVQEMMGELMVAKNTTLFIVNALCMYYKMDLLFVFENTYLEFNLNKLLTAHDGEIPTGIIYKNVTNKYAVDLYVTSEKLRIIRDNMIRLEHYDKPLRGISTYKVSELESMLGNLEPNLGEKSTKQTKQTKKELYSKIWGLCLGFST
jgi:hypothetical protein